MKNTLATNRKKNLKSLCSMNNFFKKKPKHKTGCVDILIVELHNLLIRKLFIFLKIAHIQLFDETSFGKK